MFDDRLRDHIAAAIAANTDVSGKWVAVERVEAIVRGALEEFVEIVARRYPNDGVEHHGNGDTR